MQNSNPYSNNPSGPDIPIVKPRPRHVHSPGKWLSIMVLLVVIGLSSALIIQNRVKQGASAGTVTVQITPNGFEPATVTIKKGQSVSWVNTDINQHQINGDSHPSDSEFVDLNSTRPLKQNEKFTFTFDEKGTYTYHDLLNPTTFKATVLVE